VWYFSKQSNATWHLPILFPCCFTALSMFCTKFTSSWWLLFECHWAHMVCKITFTRANAAKLSDKCLAKRICKYWRTILISVFLRLSRCVPQAWLFLCSAREACRKSRTLQGAWANIIGILRKTVIISYHYYLSYHRIIILLFLLKRSSVIEHTIVYEAAL